MAGQSTIAVALSGVSVSAVAVSAIRGKTAPEWLREAPCVWNGPGSPPPEAEFKALRLGKSTGGIAVGLPTAATLLRVLRIPSAADEEIRGIVGLRMSRQMPYPDDEMVVSHEVLRRDADGVWVAAAAVPLKALESLAVAARAGGLLVARFDLNSLALWRLLRDKPGLPESVSLLVVSAGWIEILVLDHGIPVFSRVLGPEADAALWVSELNRSMAFLETELGVPAPQSVRVLGCGDSTVQDRIRTRVAALLKIAVPPSAPTEMDPIALGVAWRSTESGTLNLLPPEWRLREQAHRARRKLHLAVLAAIVVWAAGALALAIGPRWHRRQESRLQQQMEQLNRDYAAVSDLRNRVRLITQYTDQSQELLECLLEISLLLPANVTLSSFQYRRDEELRITGDAAQTADVYRFKSKIEESPLVQSSVLTGPTLDGRTQRHAFEIEIRLRREAGI